MLGGVVNDIQLAILELYQVDMSREYPESV